MKITERTIVIVLASILVIVAVAIFLVRSTLQQIHTTNISLAARQNEIQNTQTKIDNLKSLKIQFEQSPTEFQRLEVAMPTGEQMPEIIEQIQTLASKSGLTVNSIQPITGIREDTEKPVNLTVRGSFKNLTDFIAASEKNVRPIVMRSVSFVGSESGEGEISATFGLNILKAPSIKTASGAAGTAAQGSTEETQR